MNVPIKYLPWWRRLEEVLKVSLIFVFIRLLPDDFIKTNIFALVMRLQDVHLGKGEYTHLFHTFSIRLQYVLKSSSQKVYKTFSRHLAKMSSGPLQDVFKTFCQEGIKTSSKHLQNVLQKCIQDILKTSSRHFGDVFKTSSGHIIKLNCSCKHLFVFHILHYASLWLIKYSFCACLQ